jgi:hypothetical protein
MLVTLHSEIEIYNLIAQTRCQAPEQAELRKKVTSLAGNRLLLLIGAKYELKSLQSWKRGRLGS